MAALGSLAPATRSEIRSFAGIEVVELRSNSDVDLVIRAAYRQVLGNAYVMEEERLATAESMLRQGQITVRGFVRAIAQSEQYRTRFFYGNSQMRFIELNFKHLLGRAPYDESEIKESVNRYTAQGYEAEIDSYLDSLEYQENFGENIVPYHRGFLTQPGQKNVGFNRMFQLYRGYANSDRIQGKKGRLAREVALNTSSPIYPANSAALAGPSTSDRGEIYRIRVMQPPAANAPVVRTCTTELLVPFEQLSSKLQQLNRKGNKVMSITRA